MCEAPYLLGSLLLFWEFCDGLCVMYGEGDDTSDQSRVHRLARYPLTAAIMKG